MVVVVILLVRCVASGTPATKSPADAITIGRNAVDPLHEHDVTGAMVFQGTLLPALGIIMTLAVGETAQPIGEASLATDLISFHLQFRARGICVGRPTYVQIRTDRTGS